MEEIENYIVKNLGKIFPRTKLVERNKLLPGGYNIDLHLVGKKGEHIFVEVKDDKIKQSQVGQFLNYYSAISNLEPPLKNFQLVVIGKSIDQTARDIFDRLNISFKSLSDSGISKETLKKILQERRRQRLRMLTPTEAKLVSKWEANNVKIVTVEDVVKHLGSRNYAWTAINRLEEKKWLERIKRGIYLFIPAEYGYEERFPPMNPLLVGSILVEPYYYSYATSNAHHGFTTQIRPTVYIATTKAKREFKWRDNRFKFVTLSKNKFFGYHEADAQGMKVNVASPEKSIVDSVDKVKYAGGIEEVTNVIYSALKREINCKKLVDYATKMNSYSLVQRLGFLLDFLQKEEAIRFPKREKEALLKHKGKTTIYLASTKKYRTGGDFNKDWNIVQNVPRDQLLSEIIIR
jgi:predicted transcriptional regulator of viral defense system